MAAFRAEIDAACAPFGLMVLGMTGPNVLIGMAPFGWDVFRESAEFCDGAPDPLDRWSQRVLPELGQILGAKDVVYPFGGPPYAPFVRWAFDSGETFSSPVSMLVHHRAGFWISFRGALVFAHDFESAQSQSPCPSCTAPCAMACPVGALVPDQDYDVAACKAHVSSAAGRSCREDGCLVRRACPVSQVFGRLPEQSAFHMRAFMKA